MASRSPTEIIHVAAACDDTYAMPLAAMLASIRASLGPGRRVVAHVLESGLQPAAMERIAGSLRGGQVAIRWCHVPVDRLAWCRQTLRSFDTVSIASYYRLLLPEVIPADVDRLIYLDCDLVVRRDLWDLWNAGIGDTCLGAVTELLLEARYASSRLGLRLHRQLGLRPDLELFNSGVMLINLAKWRSEQVASRAIAYIREAGPYLRWHDQEALNAVAAGDWTPLDEHWNVTMHVFRRRPDAQLKQLADAPWILHYNSAIKPWDSRFRHGCRDLFYRYLDETAWCGWRPAGPSNAVSRRWISRIVRTTRKSGHALARRLRTAAIKVDGWRALHRSPCRISGPPVPAPRGREIRVFLSAAAGFDTAAAAIDRCRTLGADRVLLSVTVAERQAPRTALPPDRLHVFLRAAGAGSRHETLRQLLHLHGRNQWCVIIDADEELSFRLPGGFSLPALRDYLEDGGYDALECERAGCTARKRLAVTMRDPVRGRVFVAAVALAASDQRVAEPECVSRVAVLRYRAGMLIDRELRAVQGAHMADIMGVLRRTQHGLAQGVP